MFAVAADGLIASGRLSVLSTRRLMNGVGAVGCSVCLALVPLAGSAPLIVGLLTASYGLLAAANSGSFSSVLDNAPQTCGVVYGFANCVGMLQGVLSPYVTALILAAAGAGGGDGSAGGGSDGSGGGAPRGAWSAVWLVASGLALLGAAVFQRVSSAEVLERRWLVEKARR